MHWSKNAARLQVTLNDEHVLRPVLFGRDRRSQPALSMSRLLKGTTKASK